jgi:hypothetical protein
MAIFHLESYWFLMSVCTVYAATAGFTLPFGQYSVFVRSNGTTEIRVNGSISDYTSTALVCQVGSSRDIIALGNQVNPSGSTPLYNEATMAAVLTAYATRNDLEVLISDTDTDADANNNCGALLVHLRCSGCPSGL